LREYRIVPQDEGVMQWLAQRAKRATLSRVTILGSYVAVVAVMSLVARWQLLAH
jgi:hypothetical protein